MELLNILEKTRQIQKSLLTLSTEQKNATLHSLRQLVEKKSDELINSNNQDVLIARKSGKSEAFLDRLTLQRKHIEGLCQTLETIINLPDPIGEHFEEHYLQNGMKLYKVRVPIGSILMVYESRPNVTIDSFALCFKSGNLSLLKGGSLARHTNTTLVAWIQQSLKENGISPFVCTYLDISHEEFSTLLTCNRYIDLVIPRGGESLIHSVVEHSLIPVIFHYRGVNHVYIDRAADEEKAINIVVNSKVNRPGTCNASESILIHSDIAKRFIPILGQKLSEYGVEIRGDERTKAFFPSVRQATSKDWDTEFLDLVTTMKVVDSLEEALEHIALHGSGHTEVVVTEDKEIARRFTTEVDAAAVFVNASSRLHDGSIFGMGAEIGISTQRLHARGPMGLRELTTYKWIAEGNGQLRD